MTFDNRLRRLGTAHHTGHLEQTALRSAGSNRLAPNALITSSSSARRVCGETYPRTFLTSIIGGRIDRSDNGHRAIRKNLGLRLSGNPERSSQTLYSVACTTSISSQHDTSGPLDVALPNPLGADTPWETIWGGAAVRCVPWRRGGPACGNDQAHAQAIAGGTMTSSSKKTRRSPLAAAMPALRAPESPGGSRRAWRSHPYPSAREVSSSWPSPLWVATWGRSTASHPDGLPQRTRRPCSLFRRSCERSTQNSPASAPSRRTRHRLASHRERAASDQ
jgi:hypothetical protein